MNTTQATKQIRFEDILSAIATARHEADVAIRENPAHRRELERRLARQIKVLERIPCC